MAADEAPAANPNKIYIHGLGPDDDEAYVLDFFKGYGSIVEYERAGSADRLKRFAWITFDSSAAADAAVEGMNGKQLEAEGLVLKVALSRPSVPRAARHPAGDLEDRPKIIYKDGVFVRGLPRDDYSDEDVLAIFNSFGEILKCQYRARGGTASIKFASEDAATAALEKNGTTVGDREITVEYTARRKRIRRRRRGGAGDGEPTAAGSSEPRTRTRRTRTSNPKRIYIGGLTDDTTEADIADLVADCGTTTRVKVIARVPGNAHAFVTFTTAEEAEGALAKNGANVNGATIQVDPESVHAERQRSGATHGGRRRSEGSDEEAA